MTNTHSSCSQEANIATLIAQDRALTDLFKIMQVEMSSLRANQEKQSEILQQLTELSVQNKHLFEHISQLNRDLAASNKMVEINSKDITRVENALTLKITELINAPAQSAHKSMGAVKTALIIAVSNAVVVPIVLYLLKAVH
jgi:uncharacterized protein YigA (DUF484 family)